MGRPAWTPSEEDLKNVENLAAKGLTLDQVAACLGIGGSTLFDKKNEYPEFSDALKKGKAKGIHHIANALFELATNGNVTAQIFFLKTRAGWLEKSINEISFIPQEKAIDYLK